MHIEHQHGHLLETIVRSALHCDRCGYGGLVDADIYEFHPLEAAILTTSVLYKAEYDEEIADFFAKWRVIFDYPHDNDEYTIDDYIADFESLVDLLQK